MSFGMFKKPTGSEIEESTKALLKSAKKTVAEIDKLCATPIYPKGEVCPNCGSPYVVRRNSYNDMLFLGCSSFPKCSFSASIGQDFGGSTRGLRGYSELTNGVTVYYAESEEALKGFKGMKDYDIGVVREDKTAIPETYSYDLCEKEWTEVVL